MKLLVIGGGFIGMALLIALVDDMGKGGVFVALIIIGVIVALIALNVPAPNIHIQRKNEIEAAKHRRRLQNIENGTEPEDEWHDYR